VPAFAALPVAAAADARHPRDPREAFTAADQAWATRIAVGRRVEARAVFG
jgi:hypothetical protein